MSHRANNERFAVVGKLPVHDTNVLPKWRKLFRGPVRETNNERVLASLDPFSRTGDALHLANPNPPDIPRR